MQTDKLEDYIRQGRNEFDVATPDPAVWSRIDLRPEAPVRKMRIPPALFQAAAAILIFAMAWVANDLYHSRREKAAIATEQGHAAEMPEQLKEAAQYYNTRIADRKKELFHMASAAPDLKNDITLELEELDKTFNELKADLKDNADNQEVIEAMIQNYRMKLKILEDMLQMLNTKEVKQNSARHETNQIQL